MTNSKFVPIQRINLSEPIIKQFIRQLRIRVGWKSTEKKENEVIFMLAFVATMISAFIFGASGHIGLYPFFFVLLWVATIWTYVAIRRAGDGDAVKEFEDATDVIYKAIKRGKIGIQHTFNGYALVGVYHNDLIDEEVKDSIGLTDDDMTKLYDMLDGIGSYTDRFDSLADEVSLPVHTLEIPISPISQ